MSYILDALRRADAERERGAVPSLQSQQHTIIEDDAAPARPRSLVWAVVALAVAVLAAARLEFPRRHRAAGACAHRRVDHDAGAGPIADASACAGAADRDRAGRAAEVSAAPPPRPRCRRRRQPPAPPPAVAAAPPTARTARRRGGAARQRQRRQRSESAPRRPGAAPRPPPSHASIRRPSCPRTIRRDLPKLVIGGSSYSGDAASRMVMINGQVFHEGDRLAPDLVLEADPPQVGGAGLQGLALRGAVLAPSRALAGARASAGAALRSWRAWRSGRARSAAASCRRSRACSCRRPIRRRSPARP